MKLGAIRLGGTYLGGAGAHGTPIVTVTAPTVEQVFTTGGPNLTVTWTYSEPDTSDPQTAFRVLLKNDAGTVTYYDSGWQAGAGTTYQIVDLPTLGVPCDTTDISAEVQADSGYNQGVSALRPFQMEWGVVTCTITDPTPNEVWTASQLTAAWTFGSTRSKTQGWFRVRLLSEDGGTVYYDTGWTSGTDASKLVPFLLSDFSRYKAGVQLKNNEGVLS